MSETKICYWVTKLPTLSWEAFVEHWTTTHAQLATGLPGLRAYSINLAPGPGRDFPYDGYAMLRFDDRDAAKAAWASPAGVATAEDGELFMERPPGLMVEQHAVLPAARDGLTKVCQLVEREPSLDWDEFARRWTTEHAGAVRDLPGLAGYSINLASTAQRGSRPFDGYAVLRFRSADEAADALASREAARAAAVADGLLTAKTLVVHERVVVAPTQAER